MPKTTNNARSAKRASSRRVPNLSPDNPLFRVVSDMETPLRDLENLIDTLVWVAMGLEANFNEASKAVYIMADALNDKASAIRAVWRTASDAHPAAREGA